MLEDSLSFLRAFFSWSMQLFTSFTIPGTNVTPLQWIMFPVAVLLVVRLISKLTNTEVNNK